MLRSRTDQYSNCKTASQQYLNQVTNSKPLFPNSTNELDMNSYQNLILALYTKIWNAVPQKTNDALQATLNQLFDEVENKEQLKDLFRIRVVDTTYFGSNITISLAGKDIAQTEITDKFYANNNGSLAVDPDGVNQYLITANNLITVKNMPYLRGRFSGEVRDGEPFTGTITNMSYMGGRFSGEFKNGEPCTGMVTSVYYSEGAFSGEIKNFAPYNGVAENIKYNGAIFSGRIEGGVLSAGIIINMPYRGGSFSGEIRGGKPFTGTVTDISHNGGIFSGKMRDGRPCSGMVTGLYYKKGTFVGEIRNFAPYDGIMYNVVSHGTIFSGRIKDGEPYAGIITNMSYMGGKFSGEIRYGKPYIGTINKMPYQKGVFSGEIYNFLPYNGSVYKIKYKHSRFSGKLKNGALSLDQPRFQAESSITPFQRLLREKNKSPDYYKNLLMGIPASKPLSISEKYNVNNDNIRRYFESSLAKNTLIEIMKSEQTLTKLNHIANELTTIGFEIVDSEVKEAWANACLGKYTGPDTRLAQLSYNMYRIESILSGTEKEKEIIIKMYKLHYLTIFLESSKVYKEKYRQGIFNIYYKHPSYVKRGTLKDRDIGRSESHNLGILRSIDKAPYDMRFEFPPTTMSKAPLAPRCPDFCEMEDPNFRDNNDSDSWLSQNFQKPFHPIVNGISGSTLIQIRFLTFCKINIKETKRSDYLNDFNIIRDYFRTIFSLFVGFEGGHSYKEIMAVFDLAEVKKTTKVVFNGLIDDLSFESIMVDGNPALITATKDAEQFDRVMQNKANMHDQLQGYLEYLSFKSIMD